MRTKNCLSKQNIKLITTIQAIKSPALRNFDRLAFSFFWAMQKDKEKKRKQKTRLEPNTQKGQSKAQRYLTSVL